MRSPFLRGAFGSVGKWPPAHHGKPLLPSPGIAYMESEGQSNTVGFNTPDLLAAAYRKVYSSVLQFDDTAGGGTATPTVEQVPYVLAATGETIGGNAGPYGERCMGTGDDSSNGVGPTVGVITSADDGNIWTERTGLWLLKAATAGQHIDQFKPDAAAGVWKNVVHARRALRTAIASAADPVHYQAKIWLQGEANTNAPRSAADLSHPDIVDYPADFEAVYNFDVAQLGAQPPWFLCAISPIETATDSGVPDPYTAAINDQLRSLCRWSVDLAGAITDNANGGHAGRYFVDHGLVNPTNTAEVHMRSDQMQQIGEAIAAALLSINGSTGYSTACHITQVRPVLITFSEQSTAGTAATLDLTASDNGTLFMAAVAGGDPAPSAAQIVAGTGGGILAAASSAITGTQAPGTALSAVFSGLPDSDDTAAATLDIYAVLQASGENSLVSVDTIATPAAVPAGWDATFEVADITYSNANRTATHDPTGTHYPRVVPASNAGKRYAEIAVGGTTSLPFVGLGTSDSPVGGGTNGVQKSGWIGSNIQHTGGSASMGAAVTPGDTVQIAWDGSAGLVWFRKNGSGDWNSSPSADPAAGTGGLDISGMDLTAITPMAGLGPDDAATVCLASADWTHPAPTGFAGVG